MAPSRAERFVRLSLCFLAALMLLSLASNVGELWRLLQLPPLQLRRHRVSHLSPPKHLANNLRATDNARNTCSPQVLDASAISFRNANAHFYATLQQLVPQLPAPEFSNDHAFLCDEHLAHLAHREQWANCLPLSGRTDEPFCVNASRDDLLKSEPLAQNQICYASVLHMILMDVYEELAALDAKPMLLYGTLLGAVRNHSIIPFTEDADMGFQVPSSSTSSHLIGRVLGDSTTLMDALRDALWRKGYHTFHYGIHRVCVAPIHPLVSRLYNPHRLLGVEYTVPYVDLYEMFRHAFTSKWTIEQSKQVQPFAKVTLLGMKMDTLTDPIAFLQAEYGEENYLRPKNWA